MPRQSDCACGHCTGMLPPWRQRLAWPGDMGHIKWIGLDGYCRYSAPLYPGAPTFEDKKHYLLAGGLMPVHEPVGEDGQVDHERGDDDGLCWRRFAHGRCLESYDHPVHNPNYQRPPVVAAVWLMERWGYETAMYFLGGGR